MADGYGDLAAAARRISVQISTLRYRVCVERGFYKVRSDDRCVGGH